MRALKPARPAAAWVLALAVVALALSAGGGGAQSREETYRQKAAALAAGDVQGHYRLGLWCLKKGLEERARKQFETVIALDPEHAGARRKLGHVRYRGRWMTPRQKAELDYRARLEKLAPGDVHGHLALGTWCRRKGLLEAAAERFQKVLALDGTNRRARRELAAVEAARLEERVAAYVDADEAERPRILAAIEPRDRIEPKAVARWVQFIRARLRHKPRHDGREVTMTHHPKFAVRYRLLGRRRGKKLSLLIFLHGGGPSSSVNDRSWEGYKRLTDTPFDLVAIPRVWDDSTGAGWVMESGPIAVLSVLAEVKRAYNIDPDRVYLAGSSMGGYGTCWIGCLEPDRFAALGIIAAGYSAGGARLANLLHTPVTCHVGENDHASDHVGTARRLRDRLAELRRHDPQGYACCYQEHPGMGHSLGSQAYRDVFAWMRPFRRNPSPRRVVWEPFTHRRYVTHKHYFYWLKLEHPHSGMRIEAEIRAGNEIAITTRQVRSFTVFLNDRLIDPARPVKVVVDGETRHEGRLVPRLTAVLESLVAKEDPKLVYPYRVDLGR